MGQETALPSQDKAEAGQEPAAALSSAAPSRERDSSYLRLLIALLGTATFFEGYDSAINAVVLRDLAISFGVQVTDTAKLNAPIAALGFGAFGALFVTAIGDRIGRRPMLIWTTLLYALFTGLTATSGSITQFVIYQFLARAFLIAEYATAVTMVTEEFPAGRRGRALGVLTALGAFGLPVVALLHLALQDTRLGWRALYLVGLIPLLVVAVLRTKLRETMRWEAMRASGVTPGRIPIRQALQGGHRGDMWRVGFLFFFTHFALLGASTWWPLYASQQRGFSDKTITMLLATAYPLGVSGYYMAGVLQDKIGRKKTGTIFLIAGLIAGIATFQISSVALMFGAMFLAVFFGLGLNPVISALAAELFPTDIRATAVAFSRSVLGTSGAIVGPVTVGFLADRGSIPPFAGNLGNSVSLVALAYLVGLAILLRLPETAGKELELISAETATT